MTKVLLIALIIVAVLLIVYLFYRFKFKRIVTNCVCLLTGAPKTGKDELQNDLAPHAYRVAHFVWWFKTKVLRKKSEEPLFYCNYDFSFGLCKSVWDKYSDRYKKAHPYKPHPLDKNIRMLTEDVLLRNKRVAYKSVISITEATLVNDNMLSISVGGKEDKEATKVVNINLTLFYKLYGHESHGGRLYMNSQNILDLHYAPKRVSSSYYFIQKRKRVWWLLGLFDVLYLREMINSDMGGINNFETDVDDTMKLYVIFRPWVFKRYNCYEFSRYTDSLDIDNTIYDPKSKLVSFNPAYVKLADKRKENEK